MKKKYVALLMSVVMSLSAINPAFAEGLADDYTNYTEEIAVDEIFELDEMIC